RQGFFFRLALGPHGQLEREPRRLLSGDVFDRFVPANRFRLSRDAALQREDDLANFDLLTLFDLDLAHYAADRGRNFDHGFVGFEFHHRLAFGNALSWRDHQPHQIAGVDVLAQFGQLELAGRGGGRRRLTLWLRRRDRHGRCRGCDYGGSGGLDGGNYSGLRGGFRSGRCSSSCSVFDGEDDLPHAQRVAFSYADFSDRARYR